MVSRFEPIKANININYAVRWTLDNIHGLHICPSNGGIFYTFPTTNRLEKQKDSYCNGSL